MNSFEIFSDSAANLPDELIQKYDINIVPQLYTYEGKEFPCWEKQTAFAETAKNFYNRMREGAEFKTSLAPAAIFVESITPVMQQGKDAVIVTLSASLSGTYSQAIEAKRILEEQFPERRLYVCDSANASMGEGLLVLQIAELRESGQSAEVCAEWIKENAYCINSFVTVQDLKYLRRGGRVSGATAFAGTLLNIKPILKADASEPAQLVVYSKERGRKKAVAELLAKFDERANIDAYPTVAITHADCEEDALELAEQLKSRGVKNILIEYYDLCTGAHIGPGTLALFFYGKDRREETAPPKTNIIKRLIGKFKK